MSRFASCVLAFIGAGLLFPAGGAAQGPGTLDVRPGAGFRCRLPAAEGEEALERLARTESTEDAWLVRGEVWTDVGCRERERAVAVDPASAPPPEGDPQPLAFYHIHLSPRDQGIIEPPSVSDIHVLAWLKAAGALTRDTSIVGIILDGRGRWTFDISPDLARRLLEDLPADCREIDEEAPRALAPGTFVRPGSALQFDLQYSLALLCLEFTEDQDPRERRIRDFIRDAARLGVRVTYVSPLPAH